MPKKFAMLFALMLLPGLSACETMMASGETSTLGAASFCELAQPIHWSKRDTDETIIEVKAHNAIGVKFCAWKGAGK
jgi:hypothetical protein